MTRAVLIPVSPLRKSGDTFALRCSMVSDDSN